MTYCAVSGCVNKQKTKGVSFYRFPKDPAVCEEWVKFCCSKRVLNTRNARICSAHFSEQSNFKSLQHRLLSYSPTNRRRIMKTAVPTIKGPTLKEKRPRIKQTTQDKREKAKERRRRSHKIFIKEAESEVYSYFFNKVVESQPKSKLS